jgi:SSS family solute:Na+ symporter
MPPESTASLATVDIIIIIAFLVLVTIVGFMMSSIASKGLDDYFLGGKKIPWWVLGISTATSNFDMAGTMIIIAVVFGLGYKGFLVELRGGVGLSLAFLVIFMGKWLRRSRVMTSAEWMKLRFGTDTQGKAAHILSACAQLLLALGMIIYFAKGAGKFLTEFLPLSEFSCTSLMVAIGLFYTLAAGLYGVVFTDVIQMILLGITAIFVSVHAFVIRPGVTLPDGFLDLSLDVPAGLGGSLLAKDPGYWEPVFAFFGLCVIMWFFRTMLEGMGGVGGYTDQRFFAARSERDASLLAMESIVISILRWTMIAGLVVMGYSILQAGGAGADIIANDPERVLPVVLSRMLPAGLKGMVIAGLIAAAMSTFDSTLNAGAAYVVKDIYQSYINPTANNKQLVRMSRIATIGLCILGVGFAAIVPNINKIWSLITMGIGAGMFVPLFLRWYWPRFNGYGFAVGTGIGMVSALLFGAVLDWPLYTQFPAVVGTAFVGSVITTLLTSKTDDDILLRFYLQINPLGAWGRYARMAVDRGLLEDKTYLERLVENLYSVIGVSVAVPFQLCMLLAAMSFIFHAWEQFAFFSIVAVLCSVGLYFFWYKNLKSNDECAKEDAVYESMPTAGFGPK